MMASRLNKDEIRRHGGGRLGAAACMLTLLAVAGGAMTSCELETSGNGELDGFWQMTRLDTLATGGSCDMRLTQRYWSVQARLLQVSDLSYEHDSYLFRFEHEGDELRLSDPFVVDHAAGDVRLEEAECLQPYGMYSLSTSFCIEQLDGEMMVLRSDRVRVWMERR